MTKFPLGPLGWYCLIVVGFRFTKEIVGWKVSFKAKTTDWKEALGRALCEKFPLGAQDQRISLISDNGSQPTSVSFMRDTALLVINQIFCSFDNPKGNAETERVIRTVKEELLWLSEFTFTEEARYAIRHWIKEDYNRFYVHSALVYRRPKGFRRQWEQDQPQEADWGA